MAARARPLRAAIYTRLSRDREGTERGVERQEADCRALAERLGYEVIQVWVDNDVSASTKSRKPRPQYAQMLARARAGEVGAILAYSNSRLTRRPREFEDLIELAEHHGVRFVTVVSGEDDLSTADGRMVARLKASIDVGEAERTSERAQRAKAQAAEQGRYRGGPRPFGYDSDGLTVREAEAEVVREATRQVLVGRTLAAIARDLNERTTLRPTRRPNWDYQAVRDLVLRPRNAALVHHGRPGRDGYQEVGPASWPAIVPTEQWRAAYAVLTDSARRQQDGTRMRWLGTNIYTCGLCQAPMRVALHSQTKRHHYRCGEKAHLSVAVAQTDRFVRAAVAQRLRDPRVVAAMTEPDPHLDEYRAQRENLTSRLDRVEADYEAGHLTGAEYRRHKDRVEAELLEVGEAISASVQRSTSSPVLSALDPGRAFLDAPIDVQRAVLRMTLAVQVRPADRPGQRWTSDRLRLTPAEVAQTL